MPNLKVDKARQLTNTWGPPKCPGCGLPTLVIREIVYSSYDVAAVVAGGLTVGGKPFVKEVRRELNKLQQEINQLSKKGIEANVTANVTEINTTITLAEQKLLQNATSEGISLINQAKVAIDKLEDFLDNLEEKREHMA